MVFTVVVDIGPFLVLLAFMILGFSLAFSLVTSTIAEVKRVLEEPDPDPSAIIREFEAAKQKHEAAAKDETSARKEKLRKQLEARKKRRAAALKESN